MQCDDVNNGILRAFDIDTTDSNNEHNDGGDEEKDKTSKKESAFPEDGGMAVTGKRWTWKSGDDKIPVQVGRSRTDPCEDQRRRNPLKITRPRSNILVQARKSPVQSEKVGSEAITPVRRSKSGFNEVKEKSSVVSVKKAISESIEGNERKPGRVRKTRSELCYEIVKSDESESGHLIRKVNSSPAENFEDSEKQLEPREGSDRLEDDKDELVEDEQQNPGHEVKEFGVCREKNVSTKNSNMGNGGEDKEEVEVGEEMEVEKKSVGVKESKSFNEFRDRAEEEQSFPHSQRKLQSLVDLVMWREVSRSAFVFGMGTFVITSSSYANDLNFSLISVVAYMGLVYLAANFIFRSVMIQRGETEERQTDKRKRGEVVREEEVIRMIRLVLPFLDEFLLTLRALFSGDPSTTMKMGVVLFVMARCGSSITIWKMVKLGFFVVFTVPKIITSYSSYLSAYAEFWVRRVRDAWESCTHKKTVALAFFTLIWNLSSLVARFWAVFMLFVAFRCYQQKHEDVRENNNLISSCKSATSIVLSIGHQSSAPPTSHHHH